MAVIDSQSVKTTEVGGGAGLRRRQEGQRAEAAHRRGHDGPAAGRGGDGGLGRRRQRGARGALATRRRRKFPRLEVVYADQKYENATVKEWLAARGDPFRLEVVRRPEGSEGFVKLPKRWVVERSLAWLGRDRRHSKDYERTPAVERGVGADQLDPRDVAATGPGQEAASRPIQVSTTKSGVASRIASKNILLGVILTLSVVAVTLRLTVLSRWTIPQNGMYPTLAAGSTFFGINKPYKISSEVQRGEIVVFERIENNDRYIYIWPSWSARRRDRGCDFPCHLEWQDIAPRKDPFGGHE